MIEEADERLDPLLDDVDIVTLLEEDVDSESGSQSRLRGVDVSYITTCMGKKELWRHGRDQGPQARGSAKQRIFAPRTNGFYNNCLRVDLLR